MLQGRLLRAGPRPALPVMLRSQAAPRFRLLLPGLLAGLLGACAFMPSNFFATPRVLFDGRSLDEWRHLDGRDPEWRITPDGSLQVVPGTGDLVSRRQFGDHRIHLEFRVPEMPGASGQAKGNSGVYVQGRYEVQILDSYGMLPALDRCGAIYGIRAPSTNAARPAGVWQTFEITFRAPRFDAYGNVLENARLTVVQNGVTIHENVELPRTTTASMSSRIVREGPLMLQDHGAPVEFRNIRVEDLD